MSKQSYGFSRTVRMVEAMQEWARTREDFLVRAELYASAHDWPPPPKRDVTLNLTYWRWDRSEQCAVRVRCAPSLAEDVDMTITWEGDPEDWARQVAAARAALPFA